MRIFKYIFLWFTLIFNGLAFLGLPINIISEIIRSGKFDWSYQLAPIIEFFIFGFIFIGCLLTLIDDIKKKE